MKWKRAGWFCAKLTYITVTTGGSNLPLHIHKLTYWLPLITITEVNEINKCSRPTTTNQLESLLATIHAGFSLSAELHT